MIKHFLAVFTLALALSTNAQVKILFDNTKGETSGTTADWTIDADQTNMNWGTSGSGYTCGGCTHSNPQQIPTPLQNTITSSSPENTWTGALSNWGIDLVNKGYIVESLPWTGQISYGNSSNPQDLSNYKVFVMCEPNTVLTSAEKTALVQFVNNGGGLYMVADHNGSDRNNDGWDSPHIWLDFANSSGNVFGILADTVTISPNIFSFPSLPNDTCLHGPMGNVTGIKFHAGTTFTIDPTANSTVTAVAYSTGTSGNNNVLAGHAFYGKGRVAFLGDSSPCDDGTGNSNSNLHNSFTADVSGSHEKLIVNTTIWLAAGPTNSLHVSINPKDSTVICPTQSATLTASGNATSYTWSNGSHSPSITVSPTTTTTYTVTATDGTNTAIASTKVVIGTKPTAAFTGTTAGATVTLTNHSTLATSYTWSFGDASATSGNVNTSHTYSASNTYTVKLIATNACGVDSITHPYSVTVTGIDEVIEPKLSLLLYEGNTLKIMLPEHSTCKTVEIYSIAGNKVKEVSTTYGDNILFIPVNELSAGFYIVRAANSIARFVKP